MEKNHDLDLLLERTVKATRHSYDALGRSRSC